MSPWDLIIWALAAALAIVIVGIAVTTAVTIHTAARNGLNDSKTDLDHGEDSTPIFRGKG